MAAARGLTREKQRKKKSWMERRGEGTEKR